MEEKNILEIFSGRVLYILMGNGGEGEETHNFLFRYVLE